MIKVDYHIHTEDSYDSQIVSTDLIPWAKANSYDLIAITEHYDLLPQEMGYFGTPSLSRYLKRLDSLILSNPELVILKGIEVGDFQQHQSFAQAILDQFEFDIILGSVHFLSDHTNLAIPIKRNLSSADLTQYFRSNLNLVETCKIDVLAHLGVYKRFFTQRPEGIEHQTLITEIFRVMIERDIALELNYACARKIYQSLIPEPDYIERYLSMGGRLFTIASDAHQLSHLEDHLDLVPKELMERLHISDRKSRVLEYRENH
ncbi:MAG TPA: PHP domain-containing protein [Candidatus Cloacimonadota bacterium]|nr:PHP domain-containing protein [Candidatus Cloacimonadota bacterium]